MQEGILLVVENIRNRRMITMRALNFIRVFMLTVFLLAVSCASALAYSSLNMLNVTGRTIYYVYLSPSRDNDWGSDKLSGTWQNGNSLTLKTPKWKYYDLKVVFKNGDKFEWRRIDTENVGRVTIDSKGTLIQHN